jgi:predicted phage tail component-like protein
VQYYVDKNSLDYFVYGGTSSASFNFIIIENDNLNSFENDFEIISIPGRHGDLILNNNKKKNKEINIEAYIDLKGLGDAKTVAKNIKEWLKGEVKYKTLTFSNDITTYEAIVVGPIKLIEEIEGLLNISFKFSCKEVV